MKFGLWLKIMLAAVLFFGIGITGLYMLVVNNKEYYHVKIRQNPIASFLVDKLRQSPSGSFLLDKLREGVPNPYPIDINKIPYSIFDSKTFWPIEDPNTRAALDEFKVLPGIKQAELGAIRQETQQNAFDTWHRGNANVELNKYSGLSQINPSNVRNLVPAWTYHSGEGTWLENVEANPTIAEGRIFVTTPAEYLVSINAVDGTENWRTSIYGPARRGLLWWAGNADFLRDYSFRLHTASMRSIRPPENSYGILEMGGVSGRPRRW